MSQTVDSRVSNSHILHIKVLDTPQKEELIKYYSSICCESNSTVKTYKGDSGVDLIFPKDFDLPVNGVTKIGLGIACELTQPEYEEIDRINHGNKVTITSISHKTSSEPYMLVPRSSISSTPLLLANSIGIVDKGYRGELIAPLRCLQDYNHATTLITNGYYSIMSGTRLLQIVAFDGKPIKIKVLSDDEELSTSDRGAAGLGSTGK